LGINLIHVEAKDRFLKRLEHASNRAKRRAVGRDSSGNSRREASN
jgi:GMP synthase PP-ATPase subunit